MSTTTTLTSTKPAARLGRLVRDVDRLHDLAVTIKRLQRQRGNVEAGTIARLQRRADTMTAWVVRTMERNGIREVIGTKTVALLDVGAPVEARS